MSTPDHHTAPHQTFYKGQQFHSLNDFKERVRRKAFEQHWEPSIANSNRSKVQIKCRSSDDCPFKVWCRVDTKTKVATISNVDNAHTCAGARLADRNQGSRLKFLEHVIPSLVNLSNGRVSGQQVVDAVKDRYGFAISVRQAQRALRQLRIGVMEQEYQPEESMLADESMVQEMSMDVPHPEDDLSHLQPQHQHHQQQYPPPPMAPQVLHHHHPQQPQALSHQDPNGFSLQHQQHHPMEINRRGPWILQTPSGRAITGTPHELIMYLKGAMDSSMG
jgi:hypothetical protein